MVRKIFEKIFEFLLSKLQAITIREASVFITLFIFFFTIVFAHLLISENYHDYDRALLSERVAEVPSSEPTHHEQREKKLKTLLIKNTVTITTLAFIIFAVMIGIFKIFNILLRRDIETFLIFFKSSAYSEKLLNVDAIFFAEFKKMGIYANEMTKTINAQKYDLQGLNLSLEEKVRAKTSDLIESNKKLLEEKQFSEEILQRQKEFLRHTIHETNTPLSVMLTSIELLNMKNEKNRHLSKIEAAAKNLFSIYDDLSYLVKKDQVEYPKIAIELCSYLNYRIDFFSEVAQLARLKFYYEPKQKEVFVYFNKTKLQRIIDNTLTNAIKYTLAGEIIEINIKIYGGNIDLSVRSRSKTIEDKERVFENFYREVKSDNGFGIGLGLVKSICDEEGVLVFLSSSEAMTTFRYRFKMMGL